MRSIDPVLLSKINQQNQTIYNGAEPKMSVQVSRAKTTVSDSTYWTVETIREKAGLGDLSLAARRQKAYGPPNRIYNIYVDNGVVKTAIREYPDYLQEKWKTQFELGNGSAVAIAFDGEWEFYRKKWQLKTYENPWLFWVDGSGKLWAQLWDDIDTKLDLSSAVSKVKAIRGWRNINLPDVDQGIIVGYIKTNGKVYYRNYARQIDGLYTWEAERELIQFTGIAVNLNMFITNDYRMGFIIEDSLGKIHWLITERAWAGMAVPPENISVAPGKIKIDLIPLEYFGGYETEHISVAPGDIVTSLLFANTSNEVINIINVPTTKLNEELEEYEDWGWVIEFEVRNPIPSLLHSQVSFIDSETQLPISITNLEQIEENKYRVNIDPIVESGINNIYGDIGISITGAINPAGYVYSDFSRQFTPINLVPTFIPLPELEAIWNE